MILGISGYGSSGSTAVTDYLKGYSNINVFDNHLIHAEFQILHEADGINDLKYHLTKSQERVACNAAIQRFRRLLKDGVWGRGMLSYLGSSNYNGWCDKLLEKIIQVSWNGFNSYYDPSDILNSSDKHWVQKCERKIDKLLKMINKKWSYPPAKIRCFSFFTAEEFDRIIAGSFVELFELLNIDESRINIFDMLYSAINPTMGMEFFKDAKCIIVDRDPRDLYSLAKFNNVKARFMPNNNVNSFVEYYKKIRQFRILNENVLVIQYEDMIYKYYDTIKKINDFLNIPRTPDNEFEFFDPLVSVKYTNLKTLYEQIPTDIAIIEQELSDFLYDFVNSLPPSNDLKLLERDSKTTYKGLNASILNLH